MTRRMTAGCLTATSLLIAAPIIAETGGLDDVRRLALDPAAFEGGEFDLDGGSIVARIQCSDCDPAVALLLNLDRQSRDIAASNGYEDESGLARIEEQCRNIIAPDCSIEALGNHTRPALSVSYTIGNAPALTVQEFRLGVGPSELRLSSMAADPYLAARNLTILTDQIMPQLEQFDD